MRPMRWGTGRMGKIGHIPGGDDGAQGTHEEKRGDKE